MKKIQSRKRRYYYMMKVQWFVILCLFICFFKGIVDVHAGMNDTKMDKNRMEGIYSVANVGGEFHLYYLNMYQMNGVYSYCIDLGTSITTDFYHSTSDFSISYLPEGQIEYIRSISYFGYQYLGHEDYHYYMAAQEIIWEYLGNGNVEVEWTNVLDINGPRINIDSYKRDILVLMSNYYHSAKFSWTDGQIVDLGEEIILEDFSQVLSNYEIVSMGHADAKIEGNYLKIKVGDDYVGQDQIILKKKEYYPYSSLFYYYDSSQRLISNGNFKELRKQISFRVQGSSMRGQVVDQTTGQSVALGQATLGGAVYEIYNSSMDLIDTVETNVLGNFTVDNLPYGSYYIKQIEASEGYLINEEIVNFEFSKEHCELVLDQQVIFNVIEIMKVYGNFDDEYVPEEGISFLIYDFNNCLYDEIITNFNGFATIWLPYGSYTFSQGNTSFGYSKVADFQVSVQQIQQQVIRYDLVDSLIECVVKIVTKDQESGKNITLDGFSYRVKEKGKDFYLEFNGENVFQADADGILIFPNLFSYGDYVLEQVESANGYVINSIDFDFSLDDHTNFELVDGKLVTQIDFYNQKILGKINILADKEVFFSENNHYYYQYLFRPESKFLLVADEDIVVNEDILYFQGEEVVKVQTGMDGKVSVDNLYLGSYCLIDEDTLQKECFVLDTVSHDKKIVEKEFRFTSFIEKASVFIKNTSSFGENIEGTIFEIYDDHNQIIYTGITNEDGIVKINDLPYSEYCIQQKSISDHYFIQKERQCFFLNGVREVSFVNNINSKKKIHLPNTFQKTDYCISLLLLFLIGLGVFCYQKIIRSSN